jgi:hypothetical protein
MYPIELRALEMECLVVNIREALMVVDRHC